jgi:DNA-binding NarL/FixJ family response regulator
MSRALSHPEEFLILCVEDEPSLLQNILEELEDAGFRAIGAEDGQVALALLGDQRPDLILCDITMPRMGGYELLRAVRAMASPVKNVPFLFLTALTDRLAVIEGKTAGADDYLPKPVDFDLMLATVRARLDQVVRIHQDLDTTARNQRQTELDQAARHGLSDIARTLDHITLGVFLFDENGMIIRHNAQADAVLGKVIFLSNGRLSTANPQTSGELRTALQAVINTRQSSDVIAINGEGRRPLLVQFLALTHSASAAMVVLDTEAPPNVSEALIAKLFDLTPTECRVAAAIAKGQRTDQIASDMGISSTTLAFHMRNIFRKAGVTRQQDLMALIFRSALLSPETRKP